MQHKLILLLSIVLVLASHALAHNHDDDPYISGITNEQYDPPPYSAPGMWIDPNREIGVYYYENASDNHTPMPSRLRKLYPEFFASEEIDGRLKELFPVNLTDWCRNADDEAQRRELLELIIMSNTVLDINGDHCLSIKELHAAMTCVNAMDKALVMGANIGLGVLHGIGIHSVFGHETAKKLNAMRVMEECDSDGDYLLCPYDMFVRRFKCMWKCEDRARAVAVLERMYTAECEATWNKPFAAKVKEYVKYSAYKPGPTETPLHSHVATALPTPIAPSFANPKFQHPNGTLKDITGHSF